MLTHFRKRFPADAIAKTNEWIVDAMIHPNDQDDNDPSNGGGADSGDECERKQEAETAAR